MGLFLFAGRIYLFIFIETEVETHLHNYLTDILAEAENMMVGNL